MDTKNEDTMVRQIEKSLSNNINDNLFLTGRVFESSRLPAVKTSSSDTKIMIRDQEASDKDYPIVSYEHLENTTPAVSRAEYIRQAREACLRQLSNTQVYSRPYDVNYLNPEADNSGQLVDKKPKLWGLLGSGASQEKQEENSPQDIASFRSLIIRTVCAVVLFISIFIIDKFELKIGDLTNSMIQEYVTGNDSLQSLEDIIVTWLK